MKLISPKTLAATAAERFHKAFYNSGTWKDGRVYLVNRPETAEAQYNALAALGPNPSPDEVAKVINPSWVRTPWCSAEGCRDSHVEPERVVQLWDDRGSYDSCDFFICEKCLKLAMEAMESEGA